MRNLASQVLSAPLGKTYLFSVGQAGYIIKSANGQLLGIDLYLSNCVEKIEGHMGFKRLLPQVFAPNEVKFDYLIATHPHLDHFDRDSIPSLMANQHTKLFASANCEQEVRYLSMDSKNITYIKPGDNIIAGDFILDFVSCDHGIETPDAVGVIITVDNKRIYEAGDTCLRLDRVEEYLAKGSLNIMIVPINGAYGNMDERDCVEFSMALKPKLTIPCHYGMFASHGGDPGLFCEIMKKKCPENSFFLMTLGEGLVIE